MRRLLLASTVTMLACGDNLPSASDPAGFGGRWISETGGLTLALIVDREDADGSFSGMGVVYTSQTSEAFTFTGHHDDEIVVFTSEDYRGGDLSMEGEFQPGDKEVAGSLDAPPFQNWGVILRRPR